jgi:hypothetical protein
MLEKSQCSPNCKHSSPNCEHWKNGEGEEGRRGRWVEGAEEGGDSEDREHLSESAPVEGTCTVGGRGPSPLARSASSDT